MGQEKTILLVEDSDRDAELITLALSEIDVPVVVERSRDGDGALEFVANRGCSARDISLVLLDIKLPGMSGLEVLNRLKSDERTGGIPVVMLTSSRERRDIRDAYRMGVNAYVVKPMEFEDLLNALKCVAHFWCVVNERSY
ncbi:MAG TPA: response regulator [Spirochaetota bacterium]|nr:response regulator [Spirochaetota bacterium]